MPFAAGGNSDGMARILARRLSQVFEQQFVIENRVGAGGSLAAVEAARSTPDGYTVFWGVTPQISILPAMTKVSYDPVKDFTPISALGTSAFVLIVNTELPVKTVADFVGYVRAQPKDKELGYADGGLGTVSHLAMALFLKRAGLEMTPVHYAGNNPAVTAVIAGFLPASFPSLADVLPHINGGKIRLLAVSTMQRALQIPDIPTLAESGFPEFNLASWNGLMAPAGTPKPIIDRIAAETSRAVQDPAFAERLVKYGLVPLGNGPEEFATMIAADLPKWADAVRIAGASLH
jgi:tripartite-type tricarboxylate transporter receptor subunit TctC